MRILLNGMSCKIYVKSRFFKAKEKPRKTDTSHKRLFCAVLSGRAEQKRCESVIVLLCGVDRCDQDTLDLKAVAQHGSCHNVCTDGSAAAKNLFCNNGFMLSFRKITMQFYDPCTEINRFIYQNVFLHTFSPFWEIQCDLQWKIINSSVFSFQSSVRKSCRVELKTEDLILKNE